jgi:predicted ATPase
MAYPDAWIYVLGEEGPVRTPYDQTEHYCVAKAFLTNPNKMLTRLLEEGESA